MAETTAPSITIIPVTEPTALYCQYPSEISPQPVFIELDLETGKLHADYSPEIGNSVPMRVWHGVAIRWMLPAPLTAAAANRILERIAPRAEQILTGATVEWDGSNFVGNLTPAAAEVIEAIYAEIGTWLDEFDYVQYADAGDWLADSIDEIRARLAAGVTIETLAAEYEGDGIGDPILIGLTDYLQYLAEDTRSAI